MTRNERRVAIITGSSQGIGAGLVAGYRGRGWAVAATARTIKPSEDPHVLTVEGDYASRGIRVNAVSLGIIQTPVYPADSYEGLGDRLPPLGRVGQVSDAVDGILFLESSTYITGEILHIDGGRIAGR